MIGLTPGARNYHYPSHFIDVIPERWCAQLWQGSSRLIQMSFDYDCTFISYGY